MFSGLGGVILIENGKVNVHVMRDFSKTPIHTESDLNKWLKFYNVATPLVGLGYLISSDPVNHSFVYVIVKYYNRRRCVQGKDRNPLPPPLSDQENIINIKYKYQELWKKFPQAPCVHCTVPVIWVQRHHKLLVMFQAIKNILGNS